MSSCINPLASLSLNFRRGMNSGCCISVAMESFHSCNFFLVLVLVEYHLYNMDLQNKILWFFIKQHNWFMSSFISSSKSGIINMIFQNNYNQIMEITPSRSAYHSEFVTFFFIRNWWFGIYNWISKENLAKLI